MRTLPPVQILSIPRSFWENLGKLYVGAPTPSGELAPPPREILDPPLFSSPARSEIRNLHVDKTINDHNRLKRTAHKQLYKVKP